MAHLQYVHPSSLAGGIGQLSGDGGFGGLGGEADDISGVREGGLRLWETKYQFQEDMLPMFVGEAFGRKARPLMYCTTPKAYYDLDILYRKESEFYPIQLP